MSDEIDSSLTWHLAPGTWQVRVKALEAQLREELEPCRDLPHVVDVRVKGAIGVVQMKPGFDVFALRPKFVERGVWVRPFGDIVYLMPALTISAGELGSLTKSVVEVTGGT